MTHKKGLPFDERKPKKGEEDAAMLAADCAYRNSHKINREAKK